MNRWRTAATLSVLALTTAACGSHTTAASRPSAPTKSSPHPTVTRTPSATASSLRPTTPPSTTPTAPTPPATTQSPRVPASTVTTTSLPQRPPTTSTKPAAAVVSTCAPGQLVAALTHTVASGGHVALTISLQNTGATCSLQGYPGLSLLAAAPATAIRTIWGPGFIVPPAAVVKQTLVPGSRGYFQLGYPTVPSAGQSCVSASGLGITPPNDVSQTHLSLRFQVCGPAIHVTTIESAPPSP